MLDPAVLVSARRLCLFAHYDADGTVADYVLHYLDALRRSGFVVAVASTAALGGQAQARLRAHCDGLLMRANVGLDFGGWQDLHALAPDMDPEWLLLCNDSVYGPLWDLSEFLDRLTAEPADLYGIVGSLEGVRHAQSWFLLLRRAAARSDAFRALMRNRIPFGMDKDAIIRRYELGMTSDLERAGLVVRLAYDPDRDSALQRHRPFNAALVLWRDLIDARLSPFVKVQLLRDNPMRVPDLSDWPAVVGAHDPALVSMIERDLARRAGTATSDGTAPRAANRMRPMLRRDFRLSRTGRGAAAAANAAAFGTVARIARTIHAAAGLLRRPR